MKHLRPALIFTAPLVAVLFAIFALTELAVPVSGPASAVPSEPSQISLIEPTEAVADDSGIEHLPKSTPQASLPTPVSLGGQPVVPDIEPVQVLGDPQEVLGTASTPSRLEQFIDEVRDGEADHIRGIYVEGLLALNVVQQPAGDAAFVSEESGVATEFQNARQNGVTGIMAHNHLSGRSFYQLARGDVVVVINGDGSTRDYVVEAFYQFERVDRHNIRSPFVDLANGEMLTSTQLFRRFYQNGDHLTLQTCLERNGALDYGVLFIVAKPVKAISSLLRWKGIL